MSPAGDKPKLNNVTDSNFNPTHCLTIAQNQEKILLGSFMKKYRGGGKVYAVQVFASELSSLGDRARESVKAQTEFVEQL